MAFAQQLPDAGALRVLKMIVDRDR